MTAQPNALEAARRILEGPYFENDEYTVARALLAAEARIRVMEEALREIDAEFKQANGGAGATLPLSVYIWNIARRALAKEETPT